MSKEPQLYGEVLPPICITPLLHFRTANAPGELEAVEKKRAQDLWLAFIFENGFMVFALGIPVSVILYIMLRPAFRHVQSFETVVISFFGFAVMFILHKIIIEKIFENAVTR